jgi:ATP-binding protein involved in chromosome partitioning
MGFFLKPDQAVVWRGPMLTKMIEQFLGGVDWGDIDYLIVDLPPGTGDIQLSLCQRIPLTGAAIVSTPQDVALKVAEKAVIMFNQLKTPILGLIENMSYFTCSHCGEREHIFDNGGARRAADRLGVPFLGEIPLATRLRETSDSGVPIVIADPDSETAMAFQQIARNLAAQVSIRNSQAEAQEPVKITF